MAILALFALIAAACQSATERITEAAAERALDAAAGEDVDVDLRDGRVSVEGTDGESSFSVGASTGVPDRIAAVAPIPSGFEPVTTFEQTEDGKRGVTVTGAASGGDGPGLLDDLEAALTADGWEQVHRSNINDELLSLGLQRGDDVFNVNVVVDGDEAMVTLMLIEAD